MIISIDFDGTLVESLDTRPGGKLRWKPGAKKALRSLLRAGHLVEVWSCRNNPTVCPSWMLGQMVGWFYVEGLCDMSGEPVALDWAPEGSLRVLTSVAGKPYADVYIDDRALRYSESRLWPQGYGWDKISDAYNLEGTNV